VRVSSPLTRTLVVAFVLLDVALGVLAWRHVQNQSTAAPTGGTVAAPTENPDVFIPKGSGSDNFQPQDPSTATMFDANDQGIVVIATAGTCDGTAPTVLVSEDGGRNFAPVKPDVSRVLSVNARTDGGLDIVGADDACEPVGLTSSDGGTTWTDSSVGTGWYRDPSSPTGVVVGTTSTDAGCDVMALVGLSPTAVRVSCGDGTVRSSDDAGQTWETVGGVKAVRALSFASPTSGVALVQTDDCSVSAFVTADGGDTWNQRGCVEGQTGQAVLDQGTRLLASVDATVSESADGGLTWTPAGEGNAAGDATDAPSDTPEGTEPSVSPSPDTT
jgi:hypothetical protein